MALYLVTGGAGFIGSHIVEELVARGENVRVLDNFSTGRRANIEPWKGRIEVVDADIRDPDAVRRAVAGANYVLHQAALPSVPRSVKDPLTSNEVNVTGTVNVLWAAKEAGVKRVVYAASSSCYGNVKAEVKHEGLVPEPASPYAVSKLAGEQYCRAFFDVYGLETVALRYFNVFGPRQDPDSPYAAVIPLFITRMRRGEAPMVNGDGTQTRDFTYVKNVVAANLGACRAPRGAAGQSMNVACGARHSLLKVVESLNTLLGTRITPVFGPARAGDVMHSCADISRARRLIGYEPQFTFEQGLAETVASFVA